MLLSYHLLALSFLISLKSIFFFGEELGMIDKKFFFEFWIPILVFFVKVESLMSIEVIYGIHTVIILESIFTKMITLAAEYLA
jgi:hypothetical protein